MTREYLEPFRKKMERLQREIEAAQAAKQAAEVARLKRVFWAEREAGLASGEYDAFIEYALGANPTEKQI